MRWKAWHFCFLQLCQRFILPQVPLWGILTDHDHTARQFPHLGVWLLTFLNIKNLSQGTSNSLKLEILQKAVNKVAPMKWEEEVMNINLVCLPCCTWSSLCHVGLFKNAKNLCLCSKMHNSDSISKIFTGCIERAFRHPHVKYISDQKVWKFLHKLAYNY